jgi:hypothetical protein
MNSLNAALNCLQQDLCILPAQLRLKRPDLPGWKGHQKRRPTEEELRRWFAQERAMCIV